MKYIITLSLIILNINMQAQNLSLFSTQTDGDNKSIIYNGIINYNIVASDTTCKWLAQGTETFKPNANAVQTIAKATNIHYVVFGGTWCGDTKALLPKFYATMQQAKIEESKITFLGVDRSKTTIGNLAKAFGITNVPTFIVLSNGIEIGRIVEYGTNNGKVDEEIAALISKQN
jgi:thiol-disulfide isomerase/thioredoxin